MKYDDDCDVLQTYRRYRDEILRQDENDPALIRQHYDIAPVIVQKIDELDTSLKICQDMWKNYLLPVYFLLLEERYSEAKGLSKHLVLSLVERFGLTLTENGSLALTRPQTLAAIRGWYAD